jgi:Flp pilus assembly protein TadG
MTKIRLNGIRLHDAGQSLIEMAFIIPVLLLLLLGAVEFGRLAYFGIEVTNAANAGAEYGSQNAVTAADYAGMKAVGLNDGSDIAGLTATATHSCLCSDGSSSATCLGSCPSGARMLEFVQVNTSVSVNSLFGSYFTVKPYVLNGQATEKVKE